MAKMTKVIGRHFYRVWANQILYYSTKDIKAKSKEEAEQKYLKMIEDGNVEVNESEIIEVKSEIINDKIIFK